MPEVSVLMPVYNADQYLAEAINSIIMQSFCNWELIILNDGSTDKSEEIIESFKDKRIIYLKNEKNEGIIPSRNKLINKAKAKYIAFLDSDDIADRKRLECQLEFLDKNPEYALCGTWGKMINDEGQVIKKINMPVDDQDIKSSMLFINTFVQSSLMIRKDILLEHPYNSNFPLAEDYELWCRLSRIYKLKNIPLHLTQYRWHETNISKSKKDLMQSLVKEIYKQQFTNIDITPCANELDIHYGIKDNDSNAISADPSLKHAHTWLKKVTLAGIKSNKYDKDSLSATVAIRWFFLCKERKHYSKIIFLPIRLSIRGYFVLLKLLLQRF